MFIMEMKLDFFAFQMRDKFGGKIPGVNAKL